MLRDLARDLDMTVRLRAGEYRVNILQADGGSEATAYYTSDALDAWMTMQDMARRRDANTLSGAINRAAEEMWPSEPKASE